MKKIEKKYEYAVIANDVAIFTVVDNELKILLIKMKKEPFLSKWALPGGLVGPTESIDEAAKRILTIKTGITNVYLDQLATFGEVNRDPFGRVVSVAYIALVSTEHHNIHTTSEYDEITWFSVSNAPDLAYDHADILKDAVKRLKSQLEYSNIAFGLLPKEFSLTDLQDLYQIILAKPLDKRNFRKNVLRSNLLTSTNKLRKGQASRPAKLYRFTSNERQYMKIL